MTFFMPQEAAMERCCSADLLQGVGHEYITSVHMTYHKNLKSSRTRASRRCVTLLAGGQCIVYLAMYISWDGVEGMSA